MACTQIPDLPLDLFGRDQVQKWIEQHVPLCGSIELDLRCNLRCLHCYRDGEWPSGIMDTDELKRVLDQVAEAGTIWMLFTGGEIFLRRDFFEIYEHARSLGLIVTLFTNATMVTETIADRLSEQVPYSIEVSLYGYSRETYEKVTGIEGSRDTCYRGVERLLERGLPVSLKTIVMRTNQHEVEDMARYAQSHGVPFKYSTMINPNFDGSLTPCNVRLNPEEAVAVDFALESRLEEYREYFELRKDMTSSRVFSCGAGSRTFHIDPYGNMKMCILLRDPEYSLRSMSFQQIWNEMFPPVYTQMRSDDHQCNSCNFFSLCDKCAAWSQMEKGDVAARVEYTCEAGHRRAAKLGFYDGPLDQSTRGLEPTNEVLLPIVNSGGCCS
ncbi:MAG: radical SAM protein [Acidobacteria bacterium]|nr:MAG: radical SAM protein [Acidobacteriota bacterium]